MRGSCTLLKSPRLHLPPKEIKMFEFPPLLSISAEELPNNGFGIKNYFIERTKYGHWPVYKKIQNTKTTTEIKRIKGDIDQFKRDLMRVYPVLSQEKVTINRTAGYVNIKGDYVDEIKSIFSTEIP